MQGSYTLQNFGSGVFASNQKITTTVRFEAPHTMVYDLQREDGTKNMILSYCTPTVNGR